MNIKCLHSSIGQSNALLKRRLVVRSHLKTEFPLTELIDPVNICKESPIIGLVGDSNGEKL